MTVHTHDRHGWKEGTLITVTENVGQKFTISVSPVPSNGQLDAPPVYTADTAAVTLTPSADGLSCVVTGASAGTATITVTGMSLGQSISGDSQVQVSVIQPPPPPVAATALHVTVGPVS